MRTSTIRLRRGTPSQWVAANPVLALAELGIEVADEQLRIKIGDGVSPWATLAYADAAAVQALDIAESANERTAQIVAGDDRTWAVVDQYGLQALAVTAAGFVRIGDTEYQTVDNAFRVVDQNGRIAMEIDANGKTSIFDLVGGGGSAGVTDLHVFVAAGQSNMKGHAQPYGGELDPPNPRIRQYGVTRRVIEAATVPLDFYPDPVGVSPAWFFAQEYLLTQPSNVGVLLIPCAKGGTGFNDGSGTGGTWDDRQVTPGIIDLYNESVTQTLEALAAAGPRATLKGILWHQGESDQSRWSEYEAQLDRLITKYRTDLGNPNLPFVVGQMTQEGFAVQPAKLNVDAVHQATPARFRYAGFAPSKPGGTNYTDTTHFSRTGVEQLGKEFVAAYHRALANYPGFGPQQPLNVRAKFVNGVLTVAWDQQPRRVTSYRVEYRIDGGPWVQVTRTYPMNLSETITGLTGTVAEARVTSVNLAQEQATYVPALAPHIEW